MKENVENSVREIPEMTQDAPQPKRSKGLAEFSLFIEKENLSKILPPLIGILFICIIYIFNSHRGQRLMREADMLRREIKELRAEFISLKSEQEYRSKLSQVSRKLEANGLKELRTPPFVIYYEKDDTKP